MNRKTIARPRSERPQKARQAERAQRAEKAPRGEARVQRAEGRPRVEAQVQRAERAPRAEARVQRAERPKREARVERSSSRQERQILAPRRAAESAQRRDRSIERRPSADRQLMGRRIEPRAAERQIAGSPNPSLSAAPLASNAGRLNHAWIVARTGLSAVRSRSTAAWSANRKRLSAVTPDRASRNRAPSARGRLWQRVVPSCRRAFASTPIAEATSGGPCGLASGSIRSVRRLYADHLPGPLFRHSGLLLSL